mgnify:CR=1 FL=1
MPPLADAGEVAPEAGLTPLGSGKREATRPSARTRTSRFSPSVSRAIATVVTGNTAPTPNPITARIAIMPAIGNPTGQIASAANPAIAITKPANTVFKLVAI